MSQKIALLISGCYADLYAGLQALQVAARTDARIYVLQLAEGGADCAEIDPVARMISMSKERNML